MYKLRSLSQISVQKHKLFDLRKHEKDLCLMLWLRIRWIINWCSGSGSVQSELQIHTFKQDQDAKKFKKKIILSFLIVHYLYRQIV